jgi:stage II sporulation protein M
MVKNKKQNKQNFFKEQYKKSFDYIRQSKNFIFFVILIFFIFALIGFFMPVPAFISEKIAEFIRDLIAKTEGMSKREIISFIFWNNLQTGFLGFILGFIFGIFPFLATAVNGFVVGFVANQGVQSEGVFILWRLLPHGIFELPAIFISFGLGIKLGTFIFKKRKFEAFKKFFLESIRVFISIIIPLLILAAIIEGLLINAIS